MHCPSYSPRHALSCFYSLLYSCLCIASSVIYSLLCAVRFIFLFMHFPFDIPLCVLFILFSCSCTINFILLSMNCPLRVYHCPFNIPVHALSVLWYCPSCIVSLCFLLMHCPFYIACFFISPQLRRC